MLAPGQAPRIIFNTIHESQETYNLSIERADVEEKGKPTPKPILKNSKVLKSSIYSPESILDVEEDTDPYSFSQADDSAKVHFANNSGKSMDEVYYTRVLYLALQEENNMFQFLTEIWGGGHSQRLY